MSTSETLAASESVSSAGTPSGQGSLLRAEIHRITARRFIRLLVLLALVGFVVVCGVAFTQYSKPTAGVLAEARAEQVRELARSEQFRQECLQDSSIPENEREIVCGPPQDESSLPVEFFIDKEPFTLSGDLVNGAVAVGVATAALAFLVGATYIGAEWSSRSIVALLFWEPRRMRVIAVKAAVAILAAVVLGVVGQLLWLGAAQVLARARGTTGGLPPGFWGDLFAQQGRVVLLVVVAMLLGFGLANLIRNTGAALGIAFVYFAVLETAVRLIDQRWSEYLISENAAALVNPGGITIYIYEPYIDERGTYVDTGREILVSNLHGGVTLTLVCAAVIAAGTYLFHRRDLH